MLDSWRADIPSFEKTVAIVLLILNIIIPSLGTFLCACVGGGFRSTQIIVGLLQFVTTPIIIGWVWSIWWGIEILNKSKS